MAWMGTCGMDGACGRGWWQSVGSCGRGGDMWKGVRPMAYGWGHVVGCGGMWQGVGGMWLGVEACGRASGYAESGQTYGMDGDL